MGSRNRQRRAEKNRRRQRVSPPKAERRFNQLSHREVIYAAAGASREQGGGGGRYRDLLTTLAEGPPQVASEFDAVLVEALRLTQSVLHWDPYEIRRQAERRLGERHGRYVTDMLRGPGTEPLVSEWATRDALPMVDVLAGAVEVLAMLLALPPLPTFGAGAGGGGTARRPSKSGPEPRMLEKVRALLAKAESTTFPEEAEALSSKAQELMARHAIDAAMVGAGGGSADDGPTGMRMPVDDPYASAKSILLSEVAAANRCRAIWSKGFGFSTVMGFESDLMFVEILYTSLLVQATSAMVAAGTQVDGNGRSRTRSFRQAFLLAYATRVGRRLREAEAASRAAASETYGAALLPVLADRSAAVEAASAAAFPHTTSRAVTVSNAAGWAAGTVAADLASLSGRAAMPA